MTTRIKKTSVANRVPNTFVLSTDGDIGVNTYDGKMYISNSSNVFEVGANISGNVTIGGSITSVRGITFDTSNPVVSPAAGTLTWNVDEDCLDIRQGDGSTLQTGLENYIRVRNYTGQTIVNGTLVQFSGVNGEGNPTCVPLLANSSFEPIYTIGVLTNDIPHNSTGRATVFGKVRNLDTTGALSGETWAEGDILWASPTNAGKLTKVKPSPPNQAVSVAAVVKTGIVDGELLVRPIIGPKLLYGTFTSNATQNAAASNTATVVTYTTNQGSLGHSIVTYDGVTNGAIQCTQAGEYNYQFSMQLQSTAANKVRAWIWFRKNGVDISDSASLISIESNGGYTVAAWNIIVSMAANDKFQIMWATEDHTKLNMPAEIATAFCPAIPSVILTVTQATL